MAEPRPKASTTKAKPAGKTGETGAGETTKPAARSAPPKQPTTPRPKSGKASEEGTPEAKPQTPVSPEERSPVSPEERYRMVSEAAYFRAKQRGFVGGDPTTDWMEAEAEVDAILSKRK